MRSRPRHLRSTGGTTGIRRRRRVLVAALLVAALGVLTLSARALTPPAPDAAPSPALLGAWVKGDSGQPAAQQTATVQLEAALGRKLAVGHSFVPWGDGLGSLPAWHLAQGRTPLISFGGARPGEVAAGLHDQYLGSLARQIVALGRPVLLRYAGDMDRAAGWRSSGYGPAFVAAWRHLHDLFAAAGVAGAWVWSPRAEAFAGARGGVDRYWPGDRYVDWVAADGFNSGGCAGGAGWRSFGEIFQAFYAWGSARAKPLMVAETGTVEDPADPGRKAAWYREAA